MNIFLKFNLSLEQTEMALRSPLTTSSVLNIFPLNFNHKNLATLDFSACLDKDCAFLNQQEGERFGHLEQS